jgi:ATP-binding cassette, subfamily C (CFTR/MRP), member 1
MRIRSSVVTAVYRKALRLSNQSRQSSTVGEITNLMSVDASRISDLCTYIHILWSGPFQISIAIYFLHQTLGSSIFAGVCVMIAMIPINGLIATRSRKLNKEQMGNKDNRTKVMDEILRLLNLTQRHESHQTVCMGTTVP